jgi:epsilon-lactone hydrolase
MAPHPQWVQSVDVNSANTRRPGRYEIRVRGSIGPMLLQAFPALSARQAGTDTLLSGQLPDQSALYGVIHRLEALGLELLEVRSLDADSGA